MNKKLINFIKTEENLTLETKITLFNPHVVQTDLIERNASRESIQIIRTENYTCIIKVMHCQNLIVLQIELVQANDKWTVHQGELNGPNDWWRSKWTYLEIKRSIYDKLSSIIERKLWVQILNFKHGKNDEFELDWTGPNRILNRFFDRTDYLNINRWPLTLNLIMVGRDDFSFDGLIN